MTLSEDVRDWIESAERDFLKCWEILVAMKHGPQTAVAERVVLEFQPTLARALFTLEERFQQLKAMEREAIRHKKVNPNFRDLIIEVAVHREHIETVLKLGRALGDAYAWFFYNNDQDKICQHLARPANTHLPIGIGGRGEIAFITSWRPRGGCMLLYHGITSFLRLGDVSFVDMKTQAVIALGELKSRRTEDNHYSVQLHVIGDARRRAPIEFAPAAERAESTFELPPAFRDRLVRQMKAMETGILTKGPNSHASLFDTLEEDCLKNLYAKMENVDFACEPVGPGLLLLGIKNMPGATMTERVMAPLDKALVKDPINEISKRAAELMNSDSAHNSLIIGALSSRFDAGFAPLFWLPMDAEFARKLYFGEVVVITVYNPAHLLQKISASGFQVSVNQTACTIERKVGDDRVLTLESPIWYVNAVKDHLFKEEKIVEMIRQVLQMVEAGEIPVDTRISVNVAMRLL